MIPLDHFRHDRVDQEDAAQPVCNTRGEPMATVTVPGPTCLDVIAVIPEALADTDFS